MFISTCLVNKMADIHRILIFLSCDSILKYNSYRFLEGQGKNTLTLVSVLTHCCMASRNCSAL